MNDDVRAEHADTGTIWRALADPTRRALLDRLRGGRRSTGELVDAFPHLSRFAVMKHLTVLEAANLIVVRREGRMRWNHLNAVPLREMYERWVSQLDDGRAASLLDIGRLAETEHRRSKESRMTTDLKPGYKTLVERRHAIAAPIATVWEVLVNRRGDWQPQPYRTYAGDGVIVIDTRPGGVIAETWEGGGFTHWGTILEFRPHQVFEYTGAFGMGGALFDVRFELTDMDGTTELRLLHRVFGDVEESDVENYTNLWDACMSNLVTIAQGS